MVYQAVKLFEQTRTSCSYLCNTERWFTRQSSNGIICNSGYE